MVGYYNRSVIATYICLLSGFLGAWAAMNGYIATAMICILVSGLLDSLDGSIASLVKRTTDEKSFGIQIDSLCDSFCFGVFPVVIAYSLGMNTGWDIAILFCFLLAGIIRLAYFNVLEQKKLSAALADVDPDEKSRVTIAKENGHSYCYGVPITVISFVIPIIMYGAALLKNYTSLISCVELVWVARFVMVVYIPLMLIKIKVRKIGTFGKIFFGVLALVLCICLVFVKISSWA